MSAPGSATDSGRGSSRSRRRRNSRSKQHSGSSPVTVTFLGGLGDVGRNCTVVEQSGKLLVIDFGVMFPDPAVMPGVQHVLPDMGWLNSRAGDIVGLVVTHGHEDHLGGVPHFLRNIEVPLYGSALSMALAEHKVTEARLADRTSFHVIGDGERRKIGPFDVEALPITHSVPQSLCIVLHTPVGALVHTGDFKIDPSPVDGRLTDLERLRGLGDEGIALLMADSTNADRPGRSASETEIGATLRRLFSERPDRRLIVSCFASHLHRVQQICDAAISEGRVVVPVGRSMVNNVRIARQLGVLDVPDRALFGVEQLDRFNPDEVCIVCTGSQGEPGAALSQIAGGAHSDVTTGADDTVILSSHPIPGNERAVFRMVSRLARQGAEVIHDGHELVHTSGHAQRDELRELHQACRPRWFVPIEGEFHMLARHAGLAREVGMKAKRVLTLTDGAQITLKGNELQVRAGVPAPYHYVDGTLDDPDTEVIDERLALTAGFVHVTVVLDRKGRLAATPDIASRGWLDVTKHAEVVEALATDIAQAVEQAVKGSRPSPDPDEIERVVRRATGRFVGNRTRRRPAISATVIPLT
ncbi:ribonuclease J [Candidatus Poriferisodalis sp.]|uniref:ribonuclease J n=1 Tax=Candidatus Poriferisodalis sp. TaxID=3101277 RepID=UPI003B0268EF